MRAGPLECRDEVFTHGMARTGQNKVDWVQFGSVFARNAIPHSCERFCLWLTRNRSADIRRSGSWICIKNCC